MIGPTEVAVPPVHAVWWLVQSERDDLPHLVLDQSAFGAAASRGLLMQECTRLERVVEPVGE